MSHEYRSQHINSFSRALGKNVLNMNHFRSPSFFFSDSWQIKRIFGFEYIPFRMTRVFFLVFFPYWNETNMFFFVKFSMISLERGVFFYCNETNVPRSECQYIDCFTKRDTKHMFWSTRVENCLKHISFVFAVNEYEKMPAPYAGQMSSQRNKKLNDWLWTSMQRCCHAFSVGHWHSPSKRILQLKNGHYSGFFGNFFFDLHLNMIYIQIHIFHSLSKELSTCKEPLFFTKENFYSDKNQVNSTIYQKKIPYKTFFCLCAYSKWTWINWE